MRASLLIGGEYDSTGRIGLRRALGSYFDFRAVAAGQLSRTSPILRPPSRTGLDALGRYQGHAASHEQAQRRRPLPVRQRKTARARVRARRGVCGDAGARAILLHRITTAESPPV